MNGKPKAPFFVVLFLVIGGLIAYAGYRGGFFGKEQPGVVKPKGGDDHADTLDPNALAQIAEDKDSPPITTVTEYSYIPASRLPEVKGTSAYQSLEDETVRFALNVWAGWGPIILANNGFKPEKVWKTQDGKEFKVELVLIDDPVAMRDAYAAGKVHIGWATVDMLPLFMDGFLDESGQPKDSRVMPRVFQQIDWSNGGDGIVVREDIKTVADLRGKTIALAQNSPSHYFLLNMLVAAGIHPGQVDMKFTPTAFHAATAFNSDKNVAAAVSWAPDIYKLSEVKGNRLLVTTATANKLIADVWFARADFSKDHMDKIESLVRGIFDAMQELKTEANKDVCAKLMAEGYNIPATETREMFADAHSTNWGENFQFFLNQNNPTNFERVWRQAYYLYRGANVIERTPVSFDKVVDFSIIEKLGKEEKYRSQKDEYEVRLVPKPAADIEAESDEILTNTVVIHFPPNSWDLNARSQKTVDGKTVEVAYDPNVDNVLEEVSKLAGQFGGARIIIEGHTDNSKQGQVPESMVKELSLNRANAVRQAMVNKFKMDPNRFVAKGMGWDRPADMSDRKNHAKNRRVEIKIYTAEAQ